MKSFEEIVKNRKNTTKFIPGIKIDRQHIKDILQLAGQSPSGWNLQHWKFIVFESDYMRRKLLPIAYNQSQIIDSSVVIAVLGDLNANENFEEIYSALVKKGTMSEKIKGIIQKQVDRSYSDIRNAIEHAFTNAALATMTLIYAAESKGFNTGIIGGFNKQEFMEEFRIPKRYFPMVLIPIGIKSGESHPSERFDITKTTSWL